MQKYRDINFITIFLLHHIGSTSFSYCPGLTVMVFIIKNITDLHNHEYHNFYHHEEMFSLLLNPSYILYNPG